MMQIQDEYDLAKELYLEKGLEGAIDFLEFLLQCPALKTRTYEFIQNTLKILKGIQDDGNQ